MILTDDEIKVAVGGVGMERADVIDYITFGDLMDDYRAIEAAVTKKLIQSLGLYDVRPSNIWRHFYPNVNGTYIKLEEYYLNSLHGRRGLMGP